jgi:hypothetical protein
MIGLLTERHMQANDRSRSQQLGQARIGHAQPYLSSYVDLVLGRVEQTWPKRVQPLGHRLPNRTKADQSDRGRCQVADASALQCPGLPGVDARALLGLPEAFE